MRDGLAAPSADLSAVSNAECIKIVATMIPRRATFPSVQGKGWCAMSLEEWAWDHPAGLDPLSNSSACLGRKLHRHSHLRIHEK